MSTEARGKALLEEAQRRIDDARSKLPPALTKPPPVAKSPPEWLLPDDAEEPACGCRGRGWRVTADALTVERCECQRPTYDGPESVPAEHLIRYGCPPKLAGCLKSTWDPKRGKWPAEADDWPGKMRDAEGQTPDMLLLHGTVGNGKSRAAAWIMRRAMAGGRRCRWVDVPETISKAMRSIGDDYAERTFRGEVEHWIRADLVILDDVAKHADTDYQTLTLFGDWLRRLESGPGWTVATTNKTKEQLRSWEASIASRLMSGPVVEMTGGDSRRRKWWRRP